MHEDTPGLFDARHAGRGSGHFEAARLTQARVRVGVSKTDLALKVGVSAAAIGQYEAGINSPRDDVLNRLATTLEVDPEFFAVGRPLARFDAMNAHFRSLRSTRVIDRQKALAAAALLWELTFALERYIKLPEVDLPAMENGMTPSGAAALLRKHWELPDGPVKHLVATAESRGIVVAVRPLGEIDAVDAFSANVVERPVIVTTPRRTENVFRHRFSIAHELGHLLMHTDLDTQSPAVEKEADEFAAAFLTPASAMDAALPERLNLAALDRLGRTWGVSSTSLVRRMVERGRTTDSSARRAYQRLAVLEDPASDSTSAYPGEVPTLLIKAAALAAEHGGDVPALAKALRVNARRVRDLLGQVDQRPILRLINGG